MRSNESGPADGVKSKKKEPQILSAKKKKMTNHQKTKKSLKSC